MSNSVTDKASERIEKSFEVASAQSSRALFWQARYLADESFLTHMPLAFWLMDVCRPTTIIEIGTTTGQSYFTLCQAADRLNLPASLYAYVDPQGPDQAGLETLEAYNRRHYEEFSHLSVKPAAETLRYFPDGGVDLLSIDMSMPDDTIMALSDQWDRKLSDRGVLLLHNFQDSTKPEREATLHKLLEQQAGAFQPIVFNEGGGLAIMLKGNAVDVRLQQLAALKFGTPEYNNVHMIFRRLGKAHVYEWSSTQAEEQLKDLRRRVKAATASQTEAEQKAVAFETRVKDLEYLCEDRAEQINEQQVRFFELQKTQNVGLTGQEQALAELETLRAEMAAQDAAKASLTQAHDAKIHDLNAALEAAREKTRALTQSNAAQAESMRAQIAKLEAEKAAVATALKEAQTQIETLTGNIGTQTARIEKLQADAAARDAGQEAAHHKALTDLKAQMDGMYKALEAEKDTQAQTHSEEIVTLTAALEAEKDALLEEAGNLTAELGAAREASETQDRMQTELTSKYEALQERSGRELAALAAEITNARNTIEARDRALSEYTQKADEAEHRCALLAQQKEHSDKLSAVKLALREQQVARLAAAQSRRARSGAALKAQIAKVSAAEAFDADWYLETYPDVREAGLDPARHFVTSGVYEGRDPGPNLQTLAYYADHWDALEQSINPVLHAAEADTQA